MRGLAEQQSLTTLKNWVKELKQLGPDNIVIAIAGNKSDLEEKRVRSARRRSCMAWSVPQTDAGAACDARR
jgi:Ras-related protein Rab-22